MLIIGLIIAGLLILMALVLAAGIVGGLWMATSGREPGHDPEGTYRDPF